MKKLVYALFIIGFTASSVMAQDDGDKKVKLGISITPALNWLSPDNDKKFTNDGSVLKMGIGLVADFRLTDIIWLHTGIEYTGAGGKLGYKASDTAYYYYKDDAIQPISPSTATNMSPSSNGYTAYQLLSRNHKVGYVHIPIGFKLKTKELSGITYFGQIGADLFVKTSARGDDHVKKFVYGNANGTETDLNNNTIGSVVNLLNGAVHVGGGIEYRISGSTAIIASIQYRHGIMNFTNSGTDYLLRSSISGSTVNITQFPNDAKLRQVVLTIGIMF